MAQFPLSDLLDGSRSISVSLSGSNVVLARKSVTIAAGENTGSTTITDESVTENDTLSAVVTQIGLTIVGATVKAYIQGIKTQ